MLGLTASCAVLAGCGGVVQGKALSPIYDPNTAGGLQLNDVPSGLRADASTPTMKVHGSDGGEVNKLAALSVEDIEDYWQANHPRTLPGTNDPVKDLYSYNSRQRSSQTICGTDTYRLKNAFFCPSDWLIAWDREAFMSTARKFFGNMAIAGVLAHEYGHAIQNMGEFQSSSQQSMVW